MPLFRILAATSTAIAIGVSYIMVKKGKCASSSYCPGSSAFKHAKCDMKVTFPETPCSTIREEIQLRLDGSGGWVDPHNAGTYTQSVNNVDSNVVEGERLTGDGKFTDKWRTTFEESNDGGCVLHACSESQVFSILDFSTNYCNVKSLYCNESQDACPIVKRDLVGYKEEYSDCWQHKFANCIVGSNN